MNNLLFNIRFGVRHFQMTRWPFEFSFRINPAQVKRRDKEPNTWKWFEVYCIFGKHFS